MCGKTVKGQGVPALSHRSMNDTNIDSLSLQNRSLFNMDFIAGMYREGSSRSWVAIQVRNHRLPITKLEVLPSGESAWRNAPRQSWNYFVVEGKVASGPIRVRVTAIDGQTSSMCDPITNSLPGVRS